MPSWKKQGRIFHLEETENRTTHCQVPSPYIMHDRIRIYYACRKDGKAFPAFFDLSKDLKTILHVHEQPIMGLGAPGMFDSDGIMPSCVIENQGELWMYYIGWNARTEGARYQNEIGLAISVDGGETFTRKFQGPVVGRSHLEPGLAVMPCVTNKNWFRMWYQSGTGWHNIGDQYEPTYSIKSAYSSDGIKWERNPTRCIKSNFPLEAFSRPAVIRGDDDLWRMWYCHRGSEDYRDGKGAYRIGYGESMDGVNFIRMDDKAGLDIGADGEWDSKMVCYPAVVGIDGKFVMFYNGNSFGQTGIGVALWQ